MRAILYFQAVEREDVRPVLSDSGHPGEAVCSLPYVPDGSLQPSNLSAAAVPVLLSCLARDSRI